MKTNEKKQIYEFGPFYLDAIEKILLCESQKVSLTPKYFDLLLILLRCRKRVVEKRELMDALWPDLEAGENNLDVGICAIRAALRNNDTQAPEYIKTFARRGFQFVADVLEIEVPITIAIPPLQPADPQSPLLKSLGPGMADTIATKLNKIRTIVVRPPSAVINYMDDDGSDLNPLVIGHQMVADYVFIGRIRQEGDFLRVNAELVNVRDNEKASESFKAHITEVLDLEEQIYSWIEQTLELDPTIEEREQASKRYTKNPEADAKYKKGRVFRHTFTEDGLNRAISYFRQATEIDDQFARAYASIADCYTWLGLLNLRPPKETYAEAREWAHKALERDNKIANAHASLAFTSMFFEWDWEGAERGFRLAIELNPNYPTAHLGFALLLTALGRFSEALIEINKALRVDPTSLIINVTKGIILYEAREYDRSLEQFENTIELNRFYDPIYYGLALTYEQKGMFREAIRAARIAVRLSDRHPMKIMARVHVHAMSKEWSETKKALGDLNALLGAEYIISQFHIALVYAALGNKEQALDCLWKAREDQDQWLFLAGVEPRLDSLRSEPRFAELLLSIGLAPPDPSK
jgi:DNA-binding winged helix-turn-helix (wHTH) protein/tetratricopeptide (TPR) repeat protein